MSMLDSFGKGLNATVVGASGGIGTALVDLLNRDDRVATVHALTRLAGYPLRDKIWQCPIEIREEATIRNATERVTAAAPIDLVIVASGVLHHGTRLQPEKSMRELNATAMQEVFMINTIGPALVAKHMLPKMRSDAKTVFAALSARVGSISDNRLGGWASYRASKSALNSLIKTLSIEQARSHRESIVVTLHPGSVDTDLSRPFQSRVPKGQLFTPEAAAEHLLRVINALEPPDTGGFFAWDGEAIEY